MDREWPRAFVRLKGELLTKANNSCYIEGPLLSIPHFPQCKVRIVWLQIFRAGGTPPPITRMTVKIKGLQNGHLVKRLNLKSLPFLWSC